MSASINFPGFLPPLGPPATALPAAGTEFAPQRTAAGTVNFQDVLLKSMEGVNELDRESQSMIAGMLSGADVSPAEVFTAVKKADLALRTMIQIRNKLVDAYNELKNLRM